MDGQFHRWFQQQLKARNWPQREFARQAKVAPSTVSAWVRGGKTGRVPDPDSCDIIADVLRVDRDFVLALAGHRPPDIELAPDDPRRDFIAVINKIRWDDPARVRQVKRYLEGLYDDDKLEAAKAKQG